MSTTIASATAPPSSVVGAKAAQLFSAPESLFECSDSTKTPIAVQPGQIIAAGVKIAADIKSDSASLLIQSTINDKLQAHISLVDDNANSFVCDDTLFAIKPLAQGETLTVDRHTQLPDLFKSLPVDRQARLLRYTTIAMRGNLTHIPCSHPGLEVKRYDSIGDALTAKAAFKSGDLLYTFPTASELCLPFANIYTICAKPGLHMLITDAQVFSHHCEPTTHVQVDAVSGDIKVVAMKDIAPGDLISFNYLSTEWLMDSPFDCSCGAAGCYGHIAGFSKLTDAKKKLMLDSNTVAPIVLALNAAQGEAVVPFKVHPLHPIQRGNIISPRVWRSSPSSTFVRDGTSSFDFWTPSAADSSVLPNACLVPLNSAADCNEWSLVALSDVAAGAKVVAVPAHVLEQMAASAREAKN